MSSIPKEQINFLYRTTKIVKLQAAQVKPTLVRRRVLPLVAVSYQRDRCLAMSAQCKRKMALFYQSPAL